MKLLGVGGYFAYVERLELSSDKIAEMILRFNILCLPGTMFAPPEMVSATRQLRIAFANIGCEELEILIQRLHSAALASPQQMSKAQLKPFRDCHGAFN